MTDQINPDHYKSGGIETIAYLEAKLTPEEFEGFLKGNVLKYISRARLKNGLTDLQKARWYLDKLIEKTSNPTAMFKKTWDKEALAKAHESYVGRLAPTPP